MIIKSSVTPPKQEAIIEYEKIDLLLMKYRRLANEKVRHLHMSGFQSSAFVNIAQLRIYLSNLLIRKKEEDSKIKLRTFYKLSKTTGRHWWLSLYIADLIHQIKKSKREYYNLKRASGTIIETYLEERDKEAYQLVNLQEERKIHTLLATEKSKDRARRL